MSPCDLKRHVKFNDLLSANAVHMDALSQAAADIIRSGWYIGGENCQAFESEFAAYIGCEHVVGVANGTDALELAIRSLDLRDTHSILSVANAGFYTATAARLAGMTVKYIDIDPKTQLMDIAQIELSLKGGDIGAVVITHLYGLCADMTPVVALCKNYGVHLVEDCAQAHGARRAGQLAGSFGDISTFSFYPTKNLGAIGDGGAVATNSAELAAKVRQLKQYGWSKKYQVDMDKGCNSRLDEIQAAFLRIKLKSLDSENAFRRSIANRYSAEIHNEKVQTPPRFGPEHVAHLYVVHAEDREAFQSYLSENNIQTDVHYPVPDHLQSVNSGTVVDLKHTEYSASHCLSLPCHLGMSAEDVSWVIQTVNNWT